MPAPLPQQFEEPALLMFWQNRVLIPLQSGSSVAGARQTMEALGGHVPQYRERAEGEPATKRARGKAGGATPSAPPGRDVSKEVCHAWNNGKCFSGNVCEHGRMHVCQVCGKGNHTKTNCSKAKKGGGDKATPKWGKRGSRK